MTDAPERIWARKHPAKYSGHWHDATHDRGVADVANSALGTINPFVEYIRADKVAALVAALRECEAEIDQYIRQEYPSDHPVHERYRQRDFAANPARAALATFNGNADGRQTS